MQDATETISNLPLSALVPLALLLVVGVILWAAGSRVLRAAFAATGLVVGGSAGWMIGEWLDARAVDLGGPWVFALVAGVVIALLAALVYRLAVAAALAAVCAVAAPTLALTISDLESETGSEVAAAESGDATAAQAADDEAGEAIEPTASDEPARVDDANDWLLPLESAESAAEVDALETGAAALGLDEETVGALRDARTTAEAWRDRLIARWEATPSAIRPILLGSALAGILAGLLLGSLAPSLSAAIVSSFGGSLLWMGSARMLIAESEFAQTLTAWIPDSAPWRLGIWLGVAFVGLAIQWTFRPRPADRGG